MSEINFEVYEWPESGYGFQWWPNNENGEIVIVDYSNLDDDKAQFSEAQFLEIADFIRAKREDQ